jgi:hypothetical protein
MSRLRSMICLLRWAHWLRHLSIDMAAVFVKIQNDGRAGTTGTLVRGRDTPQDMRNVDQRRKIDAESNGRAGSLWRRER